MRVFNVIFCLVLTLQLSSNAHALSLGAVHHEIRLSVAEIEALKLHYASQVVTRIPGIQVGKTTVHVYIKTVELLAKIKKFQRQNNLPELSLPTLPKKRVRSKHILALVELAQTQLRTITAKLNVQAASLAEDDSSKTASDLYESVWYASNLMDAITDPISSSDVMSNLKMIESGLIDIAERSNKPLVIPQLRTFQAKKSVDVTIALYKLLYKVALLERKLKLKPLVVPAFPVGDIKSSDAFDASGNVIADLTRIALKLKIPPITIESTTIGVVTTNDVYAEVIRLNQSVEFLLK